MLEMGKAEGLTNAPPPSADDMWPAACPPIPPPPSADDIWPAACPPIPRRSSGFPQTLHSSNRRTDDERIFSARPIGGQRTREDSPLFCFRFALLFCDGFSLLVLLHTSPIVCKQIDLVNKMKIFWVQPEDGREARRDG